jgi:hypothetical protein
MHAAAAAMVYACNSNGQASGTRTMKQNGDTIFDLREQLRQREAEIDTLRTASAEAEQRADARMRKESMVADQLAKK